MSPLYRGPSEGGSSVIAFTIFFYSSAAGFSGPAEMAFGLCSKKSPGGRADAIATSCSIVKVLRLRLCSILTSVGAFIPKQRPTADMALIAAL